jgi:hypothetical protein
MDVQVFPDPNIAFNMSIWRDQASLMSFVYRNNVHSDIMRRRKEWFDKMDFHLVMWWIEEGHIPDLNEAKAKYVCKDVSCARCFINKVYLSCTGTQA